MYIYIYKYVCVCVYVCDHIKDIRYQYMITCLINKCSCVIRMREWNKR